MKTCIHFINYWKPNGDAKHEDLIEIFKFPIVTQQTVPALSVSGSDNTDINSSQTSTAQTWNLPRFIDKVTMSLAVTDRRQSKWMQTLLRSKDMAYRDAATYRVVHTFLENHIVTQLVKGVALLYRPTIHCH